jgi:hypothetical protein
MEKYKTVFGKRHSNEDGLYRIKDRRITESYVYVIFSYPNDFKAGADRGPQFNPFEPNTMPFISPEDLMKNLPKAMGNIGKALWDGGGFPTDCPTYKISIREY